MTTEGVEMTRIWEVEVSEKHANALLERLHVSAASVDEAIRKAKKRAGNSGRITKVALVAEAALRLEGVPCRVAPQVQRG